MVFEIRGESGRRWRFDDQEMTAPSKRGTPFIGWEVDSPSHRVWIQRVMNHEMTLPDWEHFSRGFVVSQLPAIARCPTILRVIDRAEQWDFYFVSELADGSLADLLRRSPLPESEISAIRESVTAALQAVHAEGRIHGDVQPSNILHRAGAWKLADLGASVPFGEPIDCLPRDSRFVPEGAAYGAPADPRADWLGLEMVIAFASGSHPSARPGTR